MRVLAIDVPELGNRSYLVHDGQTAAVIDPSRRIQEIIDAAKQAGVTIQAVFETHIHNDYVTGGFSLARKLGVPYYVPADAGATFQRQELSDGQTVAVGKLQMSVLATPGHTFNHLSYLFTQRGAQPALFSGGSLLYGAVGRTDLISDQDTLELAKLQYRTAQFLRTELDSETELYPTHGFGSFCAATETEHVKVSTLEQQLRSNPVFAAKGEASFAVNLINSLDDYPAYYAYMAPINLSGPRNPVIRSPKTLTREAALAALHTGVAVVDMRSRTDFALRHIRGTLNIELGSDLATYVGWLIAWEVPLIVVAASAEDVRSAQELLSLIGRSITGGQLTPSELLTAKSPVASYPVRSFRDLKAVTSDNTIVILDVRRKSEWQKSHIAKAVHIPLHDLADRMPEIDTQKTVWVHCASGFRAGIAASMLDGAGLHPVLIDDNFTNAATAGLLEAAKKPYVDDVMNGQAQLVDVRDNQEWNSGHAAGAYHLPIGKLLEGDVDGLDEGKPVFLYCENGERSGMAENYLNELGFKAINIGGLADWIQAGGAHE